MSPYTKSEGMNFKAWKEVIDGMLRRRLGGLSSADLPDYLYRDAWESDLEPKDVVIDVLEREGLSL